jgi:hypothetical protein
MNLLQLAVAIASGMVPLATGFYTYDRLAGASSFKRASLAGLAGLSAGVLATLALAPIVGSMSPVMSPENATIKGLPDMWQASMLPPAGGIPTNIYSYMPETVEVGESFGQV